MGTFSPRLRSRKIFPVEINCMAYRNEVLPASKVNMPKASASISTDSSCARIRKISSISLLEYGFVRIINDLKIQLIILYLHSHLLLFNSAINELKVQWKSVNNSIKRIETTYLEDQLESHADF